MENKFTYYVLGNLLTFFLP